ncbi:MAG: SAM-dependent methyltransferase [Spirochaetales bacterium]|nr:SAM-dependent methyltransferase [Spirochaetales bacterium]
MNRKKRRIESKSSRTAGFTCMYRAASYLEKNSHYKSEDDISLRLLPLFLKFLIKNRLINFEWSFFPKGIYEYVIARTKYIDKIVKESMINDVDQILILGAGFDSRAVRFREINYRTKIYELDSPHTQTEKIMQFKKRNISLPGNTVYIPMDFNVDSITEKLVSNGFKPGKITLFLMEGIIMYLSKEAVDTLFKTIYQLASSGSRMIFDYIYASVLRKENIYYGEKNIYEKVNGVQESWLSGIEKEEIKSFLQKYNLELIQNMDSTDLEKMFFCDDNDNIIARINGTHCIAYAGK